MSGIVSQIDAFEVVLPLPRPLQLGALAIPHREYTIVGVSDEEGNMGIAFSLARNAPVAATIKKAIAPYLVNRRLDDYDELYRYIAKANVCLGTNGIFWRGLSLVDCALFDLLAQRAGQPLCEYLGGSVEPIPMMLVGGYPTSDETPESLARQIQEMVAQHPIGIKIASCSDLGHDTERLAVCRTAIPDRTPLMIDLHWDGQDVNTLLPEARKWTEFNMGWLEDPFAFDDFEGLARLADELPFPVAVGDEQTGVRHFTRLIEQGHIDIVRLDAQVCGGVQAFLEIARIAARHDLPVSCHGSVQLAAHLAAAVPNVKWVEYLPPHLESSHLLFKSELARQDGSFVLTHKAGVGYDLSEAMIRRLQEA
jgi:L-alanine-DL-glutamate epimerase-like enolase superfamily enzyme